MQKFLRARTHIGIALVLLVWMASVAASCNRGAAPPPNLPAPAKAAWYAHEVGKATDMVRDFAHDANATMPPLISEETTRKINDWHRSMVMVLDTADKAATPGGWKTTVGTSLDALEQSLPSADSVRLKKYFDLVRAVLKEVQ